MAACGTTSWSYTAKSHTPIPPPHHPTYDLVKVVRDALEEDAGGLGDVTTLATIPANTQAVATFLAKADGVLAGLAVADLVFEMVDPSLEVTWTASDGTAVTAGTRFGVVRGRALSILVAERIALNFMQRMSGIATATAEMVKAAEGSCTKVLETRKTVPGLRLLDKWAVLIGGGSNHRMGLYDMMMIKDNHVMAAGGISAAITGAEAYIKSQNLVGMCVEVETRTLEEVDEVVGLLTAANACKGTARDGSSACTTHVTRWGNLAETEASGNVTLSSISTIAATGVDFVSVGALTHSVIALDISLKIVTI
ncbi:MAG: hypothetical protein WDW38_002085 [Sanguina aurantia]